MSNSAWSGARPHIAESELMCKTGCGFYGNPAWNGHCSKCYKILQQKKSQKKGVFDPTEIRNKVSRSVSDVSEFQSKATNLVSRKFEEKGKEFGKRSRVVKSIFGKSTKGIREEKSVHGKLKRQLSQDSEAVVSEIETFFKTLPKECENLLDKWLNTFMSKRFNNIDHLNVTELGDLVHDFYNSLYELISSSSIFNALSEKDIEKIADLTEKYVTTRLYKFSITAVNAISEEKDLAIQDRIRSLNWINQCHLECKVNESDTEIRSLMDQIISALIELNSRKVPLNKLNLLVSACHQILTVVKNSSDGAPVSADDFLPALIYCLIRANPPLLQSNICYITNFAQQTHLQSGEAGYFFTNLCCAVSFIEKLTADSLGLTDMEFDRFMRGDALPPNALEEGYMSPGMQIMQRCLDKVYHLESRLEMILNGYDSAERDLAEFEASVTERLDMAVKKWPLEIRSKKVAIDEPVSGSDSLPSPLQPQILKSLADQTESFQCDFANFENLDRFENFGIESNNLGPGNHDEVEFMDSGESRFRGLNPDTFGNDKFSENSVNISFNLQNSGINDAEYSRFDANRIPRDISSPRLSQNNSPSNEDFMKYTGFSLQGESIKSIPCNTGTFNFTQDAILPPALTASNLNSSTSSEPQDHLIPPLISSNSASPSHASKESSKTSKAMDILGEIVQTFDNLM